MEMFLAIGDRGYQCFATQNGQGWNYKMTEVLPSGPFADMETIYIEAPHAWDGAGQIINQTIAYLRSQNDAS